MEPINEVPRHAAIIMDGNGRWAQERGFPRIEGHRRGAENIRQIARCAHELGVRYLTLYAFSKENWDRPEHEVNFLMQLLGQYLDSELKEMEESRIRFNVIGRIEELAPAIQEKIRRNMIRTKEFAGLTLTLALSYSSRIEITDAAKRLCERVKSGTLSVDEISERHFAGELYTAGMPDPDLLIRTSGEMRISNFLLWQISYAEIYVSPKYWPDFKKEDFRAAVQEYQRRERRFGRTEARKAV